MGPPYSLAYVCWEFCSTVPSKVKNVFFVNKGIPHSLAASSVFACVRRWAGASFGELLPYIWPGGRIVEGPLSADAVLSYHFPSPV